MIENNRNKVYSPKGKECIALQHAYIGHLISHRNIFQLNYAILNFLMHPVVMNLDVF